jgi:hypothetical protein
MRRASFGFVAIFWAVLLAVVGCGSTNADPEYVKQLRAFGAAYHSYAESTRMTPTSLDDLKKDWGNFPLVRGDIQSGQFVVAWGVSLERSSAENDQYVLGYEVDAPQNGGLVLLGGGTVREVTAEQFGQLGRFKPQGKRHE